MTGTIFYALACHRIMIGLTDDLPGIMATLAPDEILCTEPGDSARLELRRRQFARYAVSGGWFRDCPAIRAHVTAVRAGHHSAASDTPGERFVDTEAALRWVGRPNRQTLYRWASEGRITRYGTPGAALWDILELPARRADGTPAPPPPKR